MHARSLPFYKRLILLVSLAIFAFGTPFVSKGHFSVGAQQSWWNNNYAAKRSIFIQNNVTNTMVTGYPVRLRFDGGTVPTAAELYAASQASIKGDDFRIIYNNGTELSRWIQTFSPSRIDIWFKTQVDIGGTSS